MPNLGCDDSKLPQPEEYLVLKYNLSSLVANAIDESDLWEASLLQYYIIYYRKSDLNFEMCKNCYSF